MLATDLEFSHIPFPTSLRKAAAQGDERHWAVQPTAAGGTFLGPTGPAAPRSGAQDSPERDSSPGCPSRNRPGIQYAPDAVFRAPCTDRVNLESRGQGPGETDSDVSLRQNPAACWTRMEDSHVKAGEVVIRKIPGHGTIRRGPIHQGVNCPSNLLHLSVKASSASTRSRNQTAARLRFPLADPADFTLSIVFPISHCQLFLRLKWTPLLLPSLLATSSCPKTSSFPRRADHPRYPPACPPPVLEPQSTTGPASS